MTGGQALSAVVLIHLVISIVHGQAHTGGQVGLTAAQSTFVYSVILAAPLVGLAMVPWRPRAGAAIVTASMTGALVFGLINHYFINGPDHVAHVAAAWRTQFGVTAALLVVSEAAGVAIGIWSVKQVPS
jgi:hypothetical protein